MDILWDEHEPQYVQVIVCSFTGRGESTCQIWVLFALFTLKHINAQYHFHVPCICNDQHAQTIVDWIMLISITWTENRVQSESALFVCYNADHAVQVMLRTCIQTILHCFDLRLGLSALSWSGAMWMWSSLRPSQKTTPPMSALSLPQVSNIIKSFLDYMGVPMMFTLDAWRLQQNDFGFSSFECSPKAMQAKTVKTY